MRALIALAMMTAPAFADSVALSGSAVTLQPTTRPGAVAELIFDNRATNSSRDDGEYSLAHDDIALSFSFNWNASGDSDEITITPPDGLTCLPTSCVLRMPEHETGTLFLFDSQAVGM